MKTLSIALFFGVLIHLVSCSKPGKNFVVKGKVSNTVESNIKIGDQRTPIWNDATFMFSKSTKVPVLLNMSYANLEWISFLNPGSTLELSIFDNTLENIEYTGDVAEENHYLLRTHAVFKTIDAYLEADWVVLHRKNEAEYIVTIDSLQAIATDHLINASKHGNNLSEGFMQLWKLELQYRFQQLLLRYPERHLQYTGTAIPLSKSTLQRLKALAIDDINYFELPSYKRYTKAWINYHAEVEISRDTSKKHYGLKYIEAVLKLLPGLFNTQYIKDFWSAEYIKAHIEKYGIANGDPYLEEFKTNCKSDTIKGEMAYYVVSLSRTRKDHDVKIYKTENGFHLEAHIFEPKKDTVTDKKYPAIAIFHGGGWSSGNVSWAYDRAKYFANKGVVGIAVQYRLSNFKDISPIEAMQDAKDLMLWLRKQADTLHINANKIAGLGWSAGGHLITSTAVFADTIPNSNINSAPDALVLISPAFVTEDNWFESLLIGRKADPDSLSPLQLKANLPVPPTLILQGATDRVTPASYAKLFADRANTLGYDCELVIYENFGHLFTPSHLDDTGYPKPDKEISKKADEKIDAFLKALGYF